MRSLLAGHDHVHVLLTAQAMVGDREQAVGVGRQVDPDHLGLLVQHHIDEARVLVGEAVMVLAPDMRAQQVIERWNRPSPGNSVRHLEPLRVLVEHRIDDMDECLVAVEQAVPAGQRVALEPALAEVFAQHLHHPAIGREVIIDGERLRHPGPVGHVEDGAESIGDRFIRSHQAEVPGIVGDDVTQIPAQDLRRLVKRRSGLFDLDGIIAKVRQTQLLGELATVRMRIRAHPASTGWWQRGQFRHQRPALVEQLLRTVAAQPFVQDPQMLRLCHVVDRDLVGAPGSLDRQPVHHLGTGPALRRPHHDHGPEWASRALFLSRRSLDFLDLVEDELQQGGHPLVHLHRVVAGDDVRGVAVTLEELAQLALRDSRQDRRVGDLPAIQMKNGQHGAVRDRVEELVRVPAGRQWSGLRLTVTDDAEDLEVRVVEGGAVRVR